MIYILSREPWETIATILVTLPFTMLAQYVFDWPFLGVCGLALVAATSFRVAVSLWANPPGRKPDPDAARRETC